MGILEIGIRYSDHIKIGEGYFPHIYRTADGVQSKDGVALANGTILRYKFWITDYEEHEFPPD